MSFSKSARATAVAGLTAADRVRRVAKNEEGSNMDAALSAGVERTLMVLAGILHSQRAGITPLFLVPPPRDSNRCSVLSRQHIVRVAEPKDAYWCRGHRNN